MHSPIAGPSYMEAANLARRENIYDNRGDNRTQHDISEVDLHRLRQLMVQTRHSHASRGGWLRPLPPSTRPGHHGGPPPSTRPGHHGGRHRLASGRATSAALTAVNKRESAVVDSHIQEVNGDQKDDADFANQASRIGASVPQRLRMTTRFHVGVAATLSLAGTIALGGAACESSDTVEGSGGAGAAAAGGSGGTGGSFSSVGGNGSGGGNTCAELALQADLGQKPVDIIFVVGNNGSMAQEISAVEANINDSFASVIEASGIDYRVIMLSKSGGFQFNVCVEEPLGGVATGACATQPNDAEPVNTSKFFHYSVPIDSDDSWCKVLSTFDGTTPDEYDLATDGWSTWLRPEASKVFVMLTDSSLNCSYMATDLDDGPQSPSAGDIPNAEDQAVTFDGLLRGLSEEHFGTETDRNYRWHSIVGLEAKDAVNPAQPWEPSDDIELSKCSDGSVQAVSPALGYQALSRLTDGLRFPVCQFANYDTVFNIIAQGVIDGALLACEFPLPEAPEGQMVDRNTVEIQFTPAGGSTQTFHQVSGADECEADAFYLDGDLIVLCPQTCGVVQMSDEADLAVTAGCLVIPD